MPNIFIPKEMREGETRVAAVPETVQRLVKKGFTVQVQSDAGAQALQPNAAYEKAGAEIVSDVDAGLGAADVVVTLDPPTADAIGKMKEGALLISHLWPFANKDLVQAAMDAKVSTFVMDQLPRTTLAQYMDALSSQMNLAGYKAVILAAANLKKVMPLMMTAGGTINPAKVVVMGAGVAGLQAIGTAKRLGAAVEATDVRPVAKNDVLSLGAKWIETVEAAGEGGYARELTDEEKAKQREIIRKHVVAADVVICTAKTPGRKAPTLVAADAVKDMKDGSVIVDLAAEEGGNCELTKPGEIAVVEGVTIVGTANIPGTLPVDASTLYAKNVQNAIEKLLFPGKDTEMVLNWDDELLSGIVETDGAKHGGALVTHKGYCVSERVQKAHGFDAPPADLFGTKEAEAPAATE